MPGSTTNFQLPYPLGADPIDIAGDVKRLADAIDGQPGILRIYPDVPTMLAAPPPTVLGVKAYTQSDGWTWTWYGATNNNLGWGRQETQARGIIVTTDAAGFAAVTYPVTFIQVPQSILVTNADASVAGDLIFNIGLPVFGYMFNMRVYNATENTYFVSKSVRIYYSAFGVIKAGVV